MSGSLPVMQQAHPCAAQLPASYQALQVGFARCAARGVEQLGVIVLYVECCNAYYLCDKQANNSNNATYICGTN